MKVYKVNLTVVDYHGLGADKVVCELEENQQLALCNTLTVLDLQTYEIEGFTDNHPLNSLSRELRIDAGKILNSLTSTTTRMQAWHLADVAVLRAFMKCSEGRIHNVQIADVIDESSLDTETALFSIHRLRIQGYVDVDVYNVFTDKLNDYEDERVEFGIELENNEFAYLASLTSEGIRAMQGTARCK